MPPLLALVRRELLRTLRKVRAFFFLACVVLISIWVLMMEWPGDYTPANMLGWRSQDILTNLIMTIYIAGLFLMPAYGATSLVVEREQHTWDLLALTLIRPAGVVLGKLLNTLGVYALLAVAVLPVIASVYFLVGVDWLLFLTLCPVVAVTAFWAASVGVMCSARLRNTVSAVLVSYVCVAALLGIYLIPIMLVVEYFGISLGGSYAQRFAPVVSSPVAVVYAMEGNLTLIQFIGAFLVQAAYGLCALFFAWRGICRPRGGRLPGVPRGLRIRGAVRRAFGFRETSRSIYSPMSDRVNPMFAKERRWGWQGRRKLWLLACLGVIGLQAALLVPLWLVLVSENVSDRDGILCMYWGIMSVVIVALVTPALLANTLTKEYERENIDALRMTLLRPSQIVWGKVWSGVRAAVPFFVGIIAGGSLVAAVAQDTVWPQQIVAVVLVSLVVTTFLVLALTMFASMLTRRTPAAILLSYVCAWTVLFGFFWIAQTADGNWNPDYSRSYQATIAFFSPLTGCMYHLETFSFPQNALSWGRLAIITPYWISNVLFHIAFAVALLLICIRGFRKSRMQDR